MKIMLRSLTRAVFALTASAAGEPGAFDAVMVIEGERTTDDREIAIGALGWRELPIPITNAEDTGNDHYGEVVGKILSMERVSTSTAGRSEIRGSGVFDMESECGQNAFRLVVEQMKRWVSVDMEIIAYEMFEEGDCAIDATPDSVIDYYAPSNCKIIMRVTQGRISGAALCAFPAFPGAVIVPAGTEIPAATENGRPEADPSVVVDPLGSPLGSTVAYAPSEPIAASAVIAHAASVRPPSEWFVEAVELAERLARTVVTDDGRVYGYVAFEDVCHIGFADQCLTIAAVGENFSHFMVGSVKAADCECEIPTGPIVLGTDHADRFVDARTATAHYDNTGSAVADVAVGRNEHGIWFAGALRQDATPEQVHALRASGVSGDWRKIGGNLELIAILAVNTPGFPAVAAGITASGQVSLVAAGARAPLELVDESAELRAELAFLRDELASLRRITNTFRADAANRMLEAITASASPGSDQ